MNPYETNKLLFAEIFNEYFINKLHKKDLWSETKHWPKLHRGPYPKASKIYGRKVCWVQFHWSIRRKSQKHNQKNEIKKSAGADGLTQEQLIHGAENLVPSLTKIINSSLKSGIFPEAWKEAIVSPILKKGSPQEKSNYSPVSCLKVLS